MRLPLAAALLGLLSACASAPPAPSTPADSCRARFETLDAQVRAAEAGDGGARRIAGFPYLRTDRFLASFRDEVGNEERFADWVASLREADRQARRAELANLRQSLDTAAEWFALEDCADELIATELADPAARRRLRAAARVGDDYSTVQRLFGLYPLAVPFLNLGIANFHGELRADYDAPLPSASPERPLVLWQGAEESSRDFVNGARLVRETGRNALGIPELSEEAWIALFTLHAPAFWIETASDADRPGTPTWRDGEPTVDTTRPQLFLQPAYTRIGDEVLIQLVYTIWFAERPRRGALDSYAGALDGIIWRITLGPDGYPLVHDTIHPCGCYHLLFPVRDLAMSRRGGFFQEPVLAPQGVAPWWQIAVRVASGTHFVERVVPLSTATANEKGQLPLLSANALRSLPDDQAGRRSLFQPNGIVAGTQRGERFWLWPSGVKSPGAMRQWGHHATSFVGKTHFDEPRLLEKLFADPLAAPTQGR